MEETIEAMIDETSLEKVLQTITDICIGKAIHLRENWQDAATAKTWEKASGQIENVAARLPANLR